MSGPVTWEVLSAVCGLIIFAIGVVSTVLWRLFIYLNTQAKEFSDYKTKVAETYVSKDSHQESTAQILRAIESLGNRIDGLFQILPGPRRSRGNQE